MFGMHISEVLLLFLVSEYCIFMGCTFEEVIYHETSSVVLGLLVRGLMRHHSE